MAYSHTNSKGKTYFLHSKETLLKNGNKQVIYFFKNEVDDTDGKVPLDAVPDDKEVSETKNGMLVLKKKVK